MESKVNGGVQRKDKVKENGLKIEPEEESVESSMSATGHTGNIQKSSYKTEPSVSKESWGDSSSHDVTSPDSQFTASGRKRRTDLSLEKKMDIIRDYEDGTLSKADVARKFNIACSTLHTILKNKEKIIEMLHHSEFDPERKRVRRSGFEQVNFSVYQWLKHQRELKVPVTDTMLRTKAETLAKELGLSDFVPGKGWLFTFKTKYNIQPNNPDDMFQVDTWRRAELPRILQQYRPLDIFSADLTCLMWKSLPDHNLECKKDISKGKATTSKDCITALVAANSDGSGKLPLLVIGNNSDPACFRGRRWLPVQYKFSKNGLMSEAIFKEWIQTVDSRMGQQDRKICLILDSRHSHLGLDNLQNIHVEFIPREYTSSVYPGSPGIIHSLKKIYRRKLLIQFLAYYQLHQNSRMPLDLFTAMTLLAESWTEVTQETIENCFLHAGFKFHLGDEPPVKDEWSPAADYDNIFEEVSAMLHLPPQVKSEDYLNVDVFIDTGNLQDTADGDLKEEEEEEEKKESDCENDRDDIENDTAVPTVPGAFSILSQLSSFVSAHGPEDIALDSISILRKYVEAKASKSVQSEVGMLFD